MITAISILCNIVLATALIQMYVNTPKNPISPLLDAKTNLIAECATIETIHEARIIQLKAAIKRLEKEQIQFTNTIYVGAYWRFYDGRKAMITSISNHRVTYKLYYEKIGKYSSGFSMQIKEFLRTGICTEKIYAPLEQTTS